MKISSLVFISLVTIAPHISATLCIGSIDYPTHESSIDAPHIYFEGFSIPVELSTQNGKTEASFEITTSTSTTINILCIDGALEACCKKESTGIPTCLSIPKNVRYAYYSCTQQEATTRSQSPDPTASQKCMMNWVIKKEELTHRTVPKHTIIIMLDPSFIASLESPIWDILSNFTPLARIILKTDAQTVNNLAKRATRMQLAALEMNAIHEAQKLPQKVNHNPDSLSITKGCLNLCR